MRLISTILLAYVIAISITSTAMTQVKKPEIAKDTGKGFTPIFNGKDFSGWIAFSPGFRQKIEPGPAWKIQDGELRHEPPTLALLQTEKTFENYELSLEYLIPKGARRGRIGSGLLLRSLDVGNRFVIECDINTGVTGNLVVLSDATFGTKEKTATGREVVPPRANVELPQGAWNELVVRCEGKGISVTLNGQRINEAKCDKTLSAKIVLQGNDTAVRFKNLKFRVLKHL